MEKPRIGEPCNGCGICCRARVCYNGAYIQRLVKELGETVPGPCPAMMEMPDGTVRCEIIVNPRKYFPKSKYPVPVLSRNMANAVGSGIGCDELGEYPDPEEEEKLDIMLARVQSDPQFIKKATIAIKVLHGIE